MDGFLTDRYQLTMLAAYRASGLHARRACFEAFVRRMPASRRFLVVAGVERAVEALLQLRFDAEALGRVADQPAFAGPGAAHLVEALAAFRFEGSIRAMPEGTVAFPGQPLFQVEGPLEQAQLVETLLLSILNHDIRIASKAARIRLAAGDASLLEFGSRRTHEAAAVDAARAAYVGGFDGTSNERAGLRYGIPVAGTVAHSFVMAHPGPGGEEEAFRAYVRAFPTRPILLVDTYDTPRGIDRAIAAGGEALGGVRIDSGDLGALAALARERLDRAGRRGARVVASGDLNEHEVERLRAAGAPIDAYGIGTEVVGPPDHPSVGGVYKLVEIEGDDGRARPVAKRSRGKASLPGAKQVRRHRAADGTMARDEVSLLREAGAEGEPLLVPFVERGDRVRPPESARDARQRTLEGLAALPPSLRDLRVEEVEVYPVTHSNALSALYQQTTQQEV